MDLGDRVVGVLVGIVVDLRMSLWVIGGAGRGSLKEVAVEVVGDGIHIKKYEMI
jgi:hypothetical protein